MKLTSYKTKITSNQSTSFSPPKKHNAWLFHPQEELEVAIWTATRTHHGAKTMVISPPSSDSSPLSNRGLIFPFFEYTDFQVRKFLLQGGFIFSWSMLSFRDLLNSIAAKDKSLDRSWFDEHRDWWIETHIKLNDIYFVEKAHIFGKVLEFGKALQCQDVFKMW